MKISDVKDLVMIAAVGVAAYYIYKLINKVPSGKDFARAGTETGNLLTTHAPKALGRVRLPDGDVIAVDDIVKAGSQVDESMTFSWQGDRFTIIGLGPDGVYEVA